MINKFKNPKALRNSWEFIHLLSIMESPGDKINPINMDSPLKGNNSVAESNPYRWFNAVPNNTNIDFSWNPTKIIATKNGVLSRQNGKKIFPKHYTH